MLANCIQLCTLNTLKNHFSIYKTKHLYTPKSKRDFSSQYLHANNMIEYWLSDNKNLQIHYQSSMYIWQVRYPFLKVLLDAVTNLPENKTSQVDKILGSLNKDLQNRRSSHRSYIYSLSLIYSYDSSKCT